MRTLELVRRVRREPPSSEDRGTGTEGAARSAAALVALRPSVRARDRT